MRRAQDSCRQSLALWEPSPGMLQWQDSFQNILQNEEAFEHSCKKLLQIRKYVCSGNLGTLAFRAEFFV